MKDEIKLQLKQQQLVQPYIVIGNMFICQVLMKLETHCANNNHLHNQSCEGVRWETVTGVGRDD